MLFHIKFFQTGPFNVKEHVLIAVAAGAGGGSAYGTVKIFTLFYISSMFALTYSLLQIIGHYCNTGFVL